MAHTQPLPKVTLNAIAKQVGNLYPSLASDVNNLQQSAELTETFSVWFLPADAIATGNDNLLELSQDTGRWHSQVQLAGHPEVVARSMALSKDPSDWSVRQVLEGELAKAVDEAIEWVDENVEDDLLVHILDIPAYYITALWLINGEESEVVIAKLPESSQVLRRLKLYDSRDFLAALRQEPMPMGFLA